MGMLSFAQSNIDNSFFDHVDYRGAFGSTDWTSGWANFTPQNTVYPTADVTVEAGSLSQNTTWGESVVANKSSFAHANLTNAFFDKVDYIGAFGDNDWTNGWSNFDCQNTVYPAISVTIEAGDISSNTTWTADKTYLLNGFVYVKPGVTLTIEAGTVIRGDKTNKGTIIVEMGAKLNAIGTQLNPIVFTSNQSAGSRNYGDWGGIILLGKSSINQAGGTATIEGGVGRSYGGGTTPDVADNSGTLKYVRIEFPGIAFEPNNEINGLTLGGVGSGTTLDYIQVSYSGDDSYEWFGGTVNAKHLIAYRGLDDDFDTDNGYSGMIQFAVALRDPAIADEAGDSNGFESDNDATGSTNTPYVHAIFSNFSMYGPLVTPQTTVNPAYARGIFIRRNSRLNIFNSVIAGFVKGMQLKDDLTQAAATAGELNIENCIIAGCVTNFNSDFERNYFKDASRHNDTLTNNSDLHVIDPFNLAARPNFLYNPGHTYLLNGFVYVPTGVTLTIKPGTVIRGDKTNKGTVIVEMGGKLIAEGTMQKPIVFTSNQTAGSRNLGDWGGIILLGKSAINQAGGTATIEGGVGRTFGGGTSPDLADNSGVMKYVRIEFPGIAFEPNNEINGLTLGGVGSGTTLDYIQVSLSGDDSYEWFGGTVNAKHLIAFRGLDDDFDTDNGYSGMIQYAVALRDPAIADEAGDSNGFESDNDATGSTNTPYTHAIFSNFSMFGPKVVPTTDVNAAYARGIYIRRNSRLSIYNSIIAGHIKGMQLKDALTQEAATANNLRIENVIIAGSSSKNFDSDFERNYFKDATRHNDTLVNNTDLKLEDAFNLSAPDFMPKSDSPVLTGSYWNIPAASITFMVNDGTNAIAGADVTIGTTTKTTDATGKIVFTEMAANSYTYIVEAAGFKTKTGSVTVSGTDVTETVTLTVNNSNTYSVIFAVKDSKVSTPIEGADVTIGDKTVTTDADGFATFEDLTTGIYSYQVSKTDYEQVSTTVEVADKDLVVNVPLVSTVGVSDNETELVSVYPNPVHDELFITNVAEGSQVVIYNITGQVVKQTPLFGNSINVADLNKGLYIISIITPDNQAHVQRLVKQ